MSSYFLWCNMNSTSCADFITLLTAAGVENFPRNSFEFPHPRNKCLGCINVWWANSPQFQFNFWTVMTQTKSACVKCTEGYLTGLNMFKVLDSLFLHLSSQNNANKTAAPLLPLLTEARYYSGENKQSTDTVLWTIEDHTLFEKTWIHTSRHIIINTDCEKETGQSQMGRGHWVTDICYNCSELWT